MPGGRELKKENIKVVTQNDFITAKSLSNMPLNARKLLYIAISQCELADNEFYEYKLTIPEFAQMMGIEETNVYENADNIVSKVITTYIRTEQQEKKGFKAYPVFQECTYQEGVGIVFRLNSLASDFFLGLKGNFSQPLLDDFLKFRSPMTMAIWHLMQREMKSKKPDPIEEIKFYLSLEELRTVTGTKETFTRITDFRRFVLDKAIGEINKQCGVVITYTDSKRGHSVVGFNFVAVNWNHIDSLTELTKLKARRIELREKAKKEGLSMDEWEELDDLNQQIEYLRDQD